MRLKKNIFDELAIAFREAGKSIKDLFKAVDTDRSYSISVDELFGAFKSMNINVSLTQTN